MATYRHYSETANQEFNIKAEQPICRGKESRSGFATDIKFILCNLSCISAYAWPEFWRFVIFDLRREIVWANDGFWNTFSVRLCSTSKLIAHRR